MLLRTRDFMVNALGRLGQEGGTVILAPNRRPVDPASFRQDHHNITPTSP
ncbi:MAG: hypothetical protein GY724_17890 [Actinomycetia bacterium]|nr:hypothetical protein [Actinomycetes bacterium]MCP4222798.1 hypothetical protein [Actinomycetes bacterium]MCP5035442.1 hypothetical protein [Actinomycetes bacterium]